MTVIIKTFLTENKKDAWAAECGRTPEQYTRP